MTNAAHNQTKRIEAYSIAEFVQQVQQAIREGYELDLNTNENYPQQFGTLFTCGMTKTESVVKRVDTLSMDLMVADELQVEPVQQKRGRKPAGV